MDTSHTAISSTVQDEGKSQLSLSIKDLVLVVNFNRSNGRLEWVDLLL